MQTHPSDLSSWTLRFNQQQADLVQAEQAANEAVQQEIAQARKVREARRSSRTSFRSPSTTSSSWHSSLNGAPATFSKSTFSSANSSSRPHGPLSPDSPAIASSFSNEMNDPTNSLVKASSLRREPSSPTKRSRLDEDPTQEQQQERERIEGFSFGSIGPASSLATKPSWMTRHQTMDGSSKATSTSSSAAAASSSTNLLSRHRSTHSTSVVPSSSSSSSSVSAETSLASRPTWMKRKSTAEIPSSMSSIPPPAPSSHINNDASTSFLSRSTSRHKPNFPTSAIPQLSPSQQHFPPSASLLRPRPPPSPTHGPVLPITPASNAFLSSTSLQGRGATPSLTRLKGRGIVGEQLRKNEMREDVDEMGVARESGSGGSMQGTKSDSWRKEGSRTKTQTSLEPPKPKWQSPSHKQPISSHTFIKPMLNPTASSSTPKAAPLPSPRPVKVKPSDNLFPLRSATPTNNSTQMPNAATPISNKTPFLFSSPRINVKSFVQSVDSSRAVASPKLAQPSPRLGLGISNPSISSTAASAPSAIGLGKRKPPPSVTPNGQNDDHPSAPPTKSPKSSLRGLAHSSLRQKDTPAVPKLQDVFVRPAFTSRKTVEERETRKAQASIGRKGGKSAVVSKSAGAAVGGSAKLSSPWSAFLSDKGSVMDEEGAFGRPEDGMPASSSSTSPFKSANGEAKNASGLPSPTKTSFPTLFFPASTSSQPEPRPILKSVALYTSSSTTNPTKSLPFQTQLKPSSPIKIDTSSLTPSSASSSNDPLPSPAIESPYAAAKSIPSPPFTTTSFKSIAAVPVKVKAARPTSMVVLASAEETKEARSPGVVREVYELKDDGSPPVRKYELKDEGWVDPAPPTAGLVHPTRDRAKKPKRPFAASAPNSISPSSYGATASEPKATLSPAIMPTSATSGAFKPLSERLSVWNNQAPIAAGPPPSSTSASSITSPSATSPKPKPSDDPPIALAAPPKWKGMVGAFALPGLAAPTLPASPSNLSSRSTSPSSPNPPASAAAAAPPRSAHSLPSPGPSVFVPPPADGPSKSKLIGSEQDVRGTIEPSRRVLDNGGGGTSKTLLRYAEGGNGKESEMMMAGVVMEEEEVKKGKKKEIEMFRRKIDTTPLPRVSIPRLLSRSLPPSPLLQSLLASTPLSTETFSISPSTGSTTLIPASQSPFPHIHYDSETLAIIHRSKAPSSSSSSSGGGALVSTHLWVWVGAAAPKGEGRGKVGEKMEELERRFKTEAKIVFQGQEPEELMRVLGQGEGLIVRQGPREHWDADNTALYSIRHVGGSTYIDQIDLSPSSLTSRHPLILSVLSQTFLYIARGSLASELAAARAYAESLARPTGSEVIVIEEERGGKSVEEEELFWMCFGDDEGGGGGEGGSRAEHWRWRRGLEGKGGDELRVWKVDHEADSPLTEIDPTFAPHVWSRPVSIMLTTFELYVVVHHDARFQQTNIRLALKVAEDMSTHLDLDRSRSFKPPVHVLILPSRVPVDLAVYFRFLNIDVVVNNSLPHDHLNLLPLVDAKAQLAQEAFPKALLTDKSFLPLGLHWSDLS